MQGVILKESKDSLELLLEMEENSMGDQEVLDKVKEAKEKVKVKE